MPLIRSFPLRPFLTDGGDGSHRLRRRAVNPPFSPDFTRVDEGRTLFHSVDGLGGAVWYAGCHHPAYLTLGHLVATVTPPENIESCSSSLASLAPFGMSK